MKKEKSKKISPFLLVLQVGMTGFEPATTRPPDVYSNRTELHPALSWYYKISKLLIMLQRSRDNNPKPP